MSRIRERPRERDDGERRSGRYICTPGPRMQKIAFRRKGAKINRVASGRN